jgi:putative flippase GtrA
LRINTKEVVRFIAIGAIGFAVEAIILWLLVGIQSWNPYAARFISFPVAVTTTWLLNRSFTFKKSGVRKDREYILYTSMQCIGAFINISVYVWHIEQFPEYHRQPIFSLALGSAVAMVFNFLASKYIVFRRYDSRL